MIKEILVAIIIIAITPSPVLAHSGRTDSNGGHNCNVGACAGTYHYHNGGTYTPPPEPSYTPPPPEPEPAPAEDFSESELTTEADASDTTSVAEAEPNSVDTDCFIATAAYGTPTEKDIDTLRLFRDKKLSSTYFGKAFTSNYYKYSPAVADIVEDNFILRWYIRELHIKPIVGFLELTSRLWK